MRSRAEWDQWNSWQGNKNEFTRDTILSLIKFYPEPDTWLFGGLYQVKSRSPEKNAHSYEIQKLDQGKELIGRLKLTGPLPRGRAFHLENVYNRLTVSEILKNTYNGESFCGYENVSIDFTMLEIIYQNGRIDWQTALTNVKGIYLIADKKNGKIYVGSATGEIGIWARWGSYISTGHGWNKELVELGDVSLSYARENFRLTLIECWPFKTDDDIIRTRESFWKEAMLTREHGYNSN
ncbi:GIY-YIG nuclease family protein [Dyadobacter sp. CY347]|uniref:GIY-YIG nuclease family protein n=1 Tax=Dyadobacter sp. CY347 TaxID=2909336 RepID=UPI001F4775CB|nr:GIY-YIG nuclease family protein [Dyadobacter sp. CY347]MCF2491116.1 GIY-YIG nuclease family protein [Dyadobacter sp. CY347]